MASSRIKKFELPEIEEKVKPQEISRLETLLMDNGWKMVMDRIDKEIKELNDTIMKPMPMGLNDEQERIYYKDLERIKMRIYEKQQLKTIPYDIMREYGETEFSVDRSNDI